MKGWLWCKNLQCSSLRKKKGMIKEIKGCFLYMNLLNKFYNDTIMCEDGFFLEGYISNKSELIDEKNNDSWEELYKKMCLNNLFPELLRGSFSGVYYAEGEKVTFFTDQVGSKALYYYCTGGKCIVSSRLKWIVEILDENFIEYHFDEMAAQYMLTYGYMLDDTTFIKEIKRILPGNKIEINKNKCVRIQYYIPTIENQKDITEDEALRLLDDAFRKAVKREFEKDQEYGYKHLVDLSGGLDSRMVTWVAHEMGYRDQTNFTYCKAKYLDFKISSRIARDLKHGYYFKQLDDFQWIYEVEDILKLNNGMALFCGITGGKDCLSNFDKYTYGIEHTGMIGDVIVSCFAKNEKCAHRIPQYGLNQYSSLLNYDYKKELLDQYENQEIFDVYTRGFLGAMSTYAIRQNYFEVGSPFLDIDFMETCFRIPIKYRKQHNIYLKWIKRYYKGATKYGWEKWAGVPPKQEFAWIRDEAFAVRKIKRIIGSLFGYQINDNMNPIDFWYEKDKEVQQFFEQYFNDNINNTCITCELKKDVTQLFKQGTGIEKMQAITVLGMTKLYFGEKE